MKLSVIIANFNGEKWLKLCLQSVLREKGKWLEVIVIDDGSNDDSVELFKEILEKNKRVKLIELKENKGSAKARNLGVKKSKGKYLLFLDVDTEVKKGALKKLTERLESDRKIGAVQAKLDTCGHFLSWWGLPYEVNKPQKVIFGGRTAGLAVKRKVFEKISGFDEDYFIYGEDTDLCWRIWLAGFRVEHEDKAVIKHWGKSSLSSKTRERIYYEGAKNGLSNILKNADKNMIWWMVWLNFMAWVVIWLKLVLTGGIKAATAVGRGWWWNVINFRKTMRKRKQVVRAKDNQAGEVMFGKMKLSDLVKKGIKWLNEV